MHSNWFPSNGQDIVSDILLTWICNTKFKHFFDKIPWFFILFHFSSKPNKRRNHYDYNVASQWKDFLVLRLLTMLGTRGFLIFPPPSQFRSIKLAPFMTWVIRDLSSGNRLFGWKGIATYINPSVSFQISKCILKWEEGYLVCFSH